DTITGDGLKHLVTLTVDPDGKNGKAKPSKITATANHLFWLPDYGTWAEAGDLEPGMWLQTAAGTWVQITAIDDTHRSQKVHNLTVDGQHTYYVLAGGSPLLVHNSGDGDVTACKIELNGNRSDWAGRDRVEGPAPKYDREKQFKKMKGSDRRAALNEYPTCVYCGVSPSTQADHIYPVKNYHQEGGWALDRAERSAEVNTPGNLTGACQPCNGSKNGSPLGDGPGEWWPPGWPAGSWWPFGGGPRP
ncbi:polymorphic toxin-type HINT domain-containing protein, partial [Streptomyces sp. NPDC002523]